MASNKHERSQEQFPVGHRCNRDVRKTWTIRHVKSRARRQLFLLTTARIPRTI